MKNFPPILLFLLAHLLVSITYGQATGTDYTAADKAKALKSIANGCADMTRKFNTVTAWIKTRQGTLPAVPVPPVLDMDCHDCHEQGNSDKNQSLINAFNKKSVQPESDMLRTLLEIARDKIILLDGHGGTGLVAGSYDNGNAYPCLEQIPDMELQKAMDFLEHRIYQKVTMMLDKYKRNGDYFIGGVQLYLGVLRDLSLLGYETGDEDEGLKIWIQSYYDKYKKRLLEEHQYQLFPGIFYLPRQMAMLGIDLTESHLKYDDGKFDIEKRDEAIETWNKAISLMHFRLRITYVGDGFDKDGDKVAVRFGGETEIRCRINGDHQSPCYEWVPENGSAMTFKIDQVEFRGHDKEVLTYDGPREFSVPVQFNINMCDKEPVFRMFFGRLWPEEEHYRHNQAGELTTPMLYRVVSATLGKANTAGLEKLVGKYKQAASRYSEADMEAWNNRMEAHRNDPGYFKTPQGKKDLAMAQQLRKQLGSVSAADQQEMNQLTDLKNSIAQKEKSNPHYIGSKEYFADQQKLQQASGKGLQVMQKATGGALTLNKLELPFKFGTLQPVDGSVGDGGQAALLAIESEELNYTSSFKIELTNAPDDRDRIR